MKQKKSKIELKMSTSTIIDIDGIPTATVSRGDDKPPIILYTIQPPPYSHYKSHRLIMQGPPPLHSPPPLRSYQNTLYNTNVDYMVIRFVAVLIIVLLVVFCISIFVIAT